MRYVKLCLKMLGYIFMLPILYGLVALILTYIPVDEKTDNTPKIHTIYLSTNGVHSDIILPKDLTLPALLEGQKYLPTDTYFAYGWGEENFYLHTQTWGDLSLRNAFSAMFLRSNTLVHVSRYKGIQSYWIPVNISEKQVQKLNAFILNTFYQDENGKHRLEGAGYIEGFDSFYRANGSYMFYKTCNSWTNAALKESGMKGSLWTPFDFGVLRWYEQ